MGWYTQLTLGEHTWDWRKDLPIETPLLFYGQHKQCGDNNGFVGYEATVSQVRANLNRLGLTIDFFKSIYSSYREGLKGSALASFNGAKVCLAEIENNQESLKLRIKQINDWISRIDNSTPSNDVECALRLLRDGINIESTLRGDESLIPSLTYVRMNNNLDKPNIIEATTFGIFLDYAHRYLPEIAWLCEVRLILEKVSSRSKVKLDLKDWTNEGGDINIIEDSIQTLALKANTYTKTFNAILGGDATYVKEYERVRLSEKWRKLISLEKGDLSKGASLEEFITLLFHKSFGFEVIAKNMLAKTEELDIIIKNTSKSDFIRSLGGPFILVECKNWCTPVGVSEARVFESKYREAGKKVNLGIFVALNGVTTPFKTHINNLVRDGIHLVVVDNKAIEQFIYCESLDVGIWLEELISKQFILR